MIGLELVVHVQNHGDVAAGPQAWAGDRGGKSGIEGFTINPLPGLPADDVRYCGIDAQGRTSEWVSAGTYCGTRGLWRPLAGFAMRLEGEAARRFFCLYAGCFADGSEVGPLEDGAPCRSQAGAALTALRLMLLPRA